MQAWIPVVSSSLYFWKSVFSFRADSILKSDEDFESFLTACISLVHEPDKPWSRQQPSCTNSPKELGRNCSPIGHHNTKHFLCSIRNRHPLEFLEIVRWESVPRGSFTRKKKTQKTFVPPFLPTRLTAPGSPRMRLRLPEWEYLFRIFVNIDISSFQKSFEGPNLTWFLLSTASCTESQFMHSAPMQTRLRVWLVDKIWVSI